VISLKPVTRADAGVLASARTGLVGGHLSAITYRYLPPADGSGYAGGADGVDADLAAVVLDLGDRGRRTITWATDGELHGISILMTSRTPTSSLSPSRPAAARRGETTSVVS